jgi:uncharacterized protein (TIGR03437 family)
MFNLTSETYTFCLAKKNSTVSRRLVTCDLFPPSSAARLPGFRYQVLSWFRIRNRGRLMKLIMNLLVIPACAATQAISFLPAGEPLFYGNNGGIHSADVAGIVTGDFNSDGHLDAVYCIVNPLFPSPPHIKLGKGDGTFGAEISNAFNVFYADSPAYESCGEGSALTTGDFNGDGKLDVASAGFNVAIYLGQGDGTFCAPIVIKGPLTPGSDPYPPLFSPLMAIDLNHDGRTDLVFGMSVWLGNGDGTFRATQSLTAPAWGMGDFNGDGNPDLVTGKGSAFINFGMGDGTFGGPTGPILGSEGFVAAIAADFDGDGVLDLAFEGPSLAPPLLSNQSLLFFNWPAEIVVVLGRHDGTFRAPSSPIGGLSGPLFAIDLNKDGKVDLVSGRSILTGVGDGTFLSAVFLQGCADFSGQTTYCADKGLALADFNNDGLPDILLGNHFITLNGGGEATLNVFLNDSPGDGLWAAAVSAATGTWPVGRGSIASSYGTNLAPFTETASGLPLPTTLGGIQVLVNGAPTELLYVSSSQINFIVPNVSVQMVSIGIHRNGTTYVSKGMAFPVYPVSPTFFVANPISNVPAATAVQVHPDSTQTNVPVYSCAASGCVTIPIDVGGDPVYLSLYGTGFSYVNSTSPRLSERAGCLLGGSSTAFAVQPTYSGLQSATGTPGLDQMNILLPSSLKGMGLIPVSCGFSPNLYGGVDSANIVYIQVK